MIAESWIFTEEETILAVWKHRYWHYNLLRIPSIRDIFSQYATHRRHQSFHSLDGFKGLLLFYAAFCVTKYVSLHVSPIINFHIFSTFDSFISGTYLLSLSFLANLICLDFAYGMSNASNWNYFFISPSFCLWPSLLMLLGATYVFLKTTLKLYTKRICYILKYLCSLKTLFSFVPRREPQSLLLDIVINCNTTCFRHHICTN